MDPATSTPQAVLSSKKLPNIVQVMFMMLRNNITNSKFMSNLHHLMIKRGKVTVKAVKNLIFHHHSTSVSSTSKRKNHCTHSSSTTRSTVINNDLTTATALENLFKILNSEVTDASPVWPGCQRSPMVGQLMILDSPLPSLRGVDENIHVDEEAGEFIQRFYAQLRLQM